MLTNQELSAAGLILPWHAFTECLSCTEVSIPYSVGKSRTNLGTQNKTVSFINIWNEFQYKNSDFFVLNILSETRIVDFTLK